jgi:hypothetical protein
MGKYIAPYSSILFESIGRGSVILIKGKSDGDKKNLYAAHVLNSVAMSNGAEMLFLSDVFYKIKKEGSGLRALKIAFNSEKSLKAALNLKTPGKISIVKNNNKTPFHWLTTKHTIVSAALREVESELREDSYILESTSFKIIENSEPISGASQIVDYGSRIIAMTLNSIFLDNPQIDIISYEKSDELERFYNGGHASGPGPQDVGWTIDVKVFCKEAAILKKLEELGEGAILTVTLVFDSEVDYTVNRYDDVDFNTYTKFEEAYIYGFDLIETSNEEEDAFLKSSKKIEAFDNDAEIENNIKKVIQQGQKWFSNFLN